MRVLCAFPCGGKDFRLERDFRRGEEGTKLVCESDGELLSVADGDLEMLLGGISEAVYENTVSIGQMKSRTGDALLLELRNYLSSYQESGDGKLNVDKALLLLKEKKKEWLNRMQLRIQQQEAEEKKIKFEISYLEQETEELEQKILEEKKREKTEQEELRREEQRQEESRQKELHQENMPGTGGTLNWKKVIPALLVGDVIVWGILFFIAGWKAACISAVCILIAEFLFMAYTSTALKKAGKKRKQNMPDSSSRIILPAVFRKERLPVTVSACLQPRYRKKGPGYPTCRKNSQSFRWQESLTGRKWRRYAA